MLLYAFGNRYNAKYLDLLLYVLALVALVGAVELWRANCPMNRLATGLVCSFTMLASTLILIVGPPGAPPDRTVVPLTMALMALMALAFIVLGSRQTKR